MKRGKTGQRSKFKRLLRKRPLFILHTEDLKRWHALGHPRWIEVRYVRFGDWCGGQVKMKDRGARRQAAVRLAEELVVGQHERKNLEIWQRGQRGKLGDIW